MSKLRIPRKLKKQIPIGLYCYKGIKFDLATGIYHIKPCVFYEHKKIGDIPVEEDMKDWKEEFKEEIVGYCKLMKCQIEDQCKSCSERYGKLK